MTVSRNPLYSFLRAKNNTLTRMGRELKYKYHVFEQAWNCYLKLVDIDYETIFTCPVCKDTPAIIILDGIAMGTTRQLPDLPSRVEERQTFPIIPLSERLFIANVKLRKMFNQYSEVGLDFSSFESMLINLQISECSFNPAIRKGNSISA